jgi:hypothetical protein
MWISVLMASVAVPVLIGAMLFGTSVMPARSDESLSHGGM